MRRREFMTLLGAAAAAWLLATCTPPQDEVMPVIGVLSPSSSTSASSPTGNPRRLPLFREGLKEVGYIEGRNVVIEYRWGNGQYELLPELANDLVRRRVDVIAATAGTMTALAAKAATSTIPIVFTTGDDPVQVGLVDSLNRPGGNVTGMSMHTTELAVKRLQLLRELAPKTSMVAFLVNSGATKLANDHLENEARRAGLKPLLVEVSGEGDLEPAIASAIQQGADALHVGSDPFFTTRRIELVALAARHALPAVYPWQDYAEVGGLVSYGPDASEIYRQLGVYAGRILKGTKPSDLPVQLPRKFDLVINLTTANALGLKLPRILHRKADRIID
jgi:putative ABC transport system substrate-binding protein